MQHLSNRERTENRDIEDVTIFCAILDQLQGPTLEVQLDQSPISTSLSQDILMDHVYRKRQVSGRKSQAQHISPNIVGSCTRHIVMPRRSIAWAHAER